MPTTDEMHKLSTIAVFDMRLSRITTPVLNHQVKIANPRAMLISVILGFLCQLSGLPRGHHAHLLGQGVVFDR